MEKFYLSVVCKSESEVEDVLNSNVINEKIFKYKDDYQYWVDNCLPVSLSELEEGDYGYEYKSKWNDTWGGDGDIDGWTRCIFENDNCAIIIFDIDKGYIYDWRWGANFIIGNELSNYKQLNNGHYEKYKKQFINLIDYDEFIKFRKDTTNIKKITEQQILNYNIIDFMDVIYPSNKNVDDIEQKTENTLDNKVFKERGQFIIIDNEKYNITIRKTAVNCIKIEPQFVTEDDTELIDEYDLEVDEPLGNAILIYLNNMVEPIKISFFDIYPHNDELIKQFYDKLVNDVNWE